MSEDDWRSKWLRRNMWPFSRRWMFDEMDEIFREMEEMMKKEFGELSKKTPRDLIQERTMPDGKKIKRLGPFVYGYSITIGPDGKPHVREFGNIKPGAKLGKPRIDIREQREPLIDIITTNGEVKVIVELPGVEKKDIKLHGTHHSLTISVDTTQRKYYKELNLPAEVDSRKGKSSYKSGVLEVTLPKRDEKNPKGEPIKIE